jgi:hypothetical protein
MTDLRLVGGLGAEMGLQLEDLLGETVWYEFVPGDANFVDEDGNFTNPADTTLPAGTAPVLSVASSATYTGGHAPTVLSPSAVLTDVDSSTMVSGLIAIPGGGGAAGDVLAATTTGTAITATYNPTLGRLTLSGTDTVANYQAVLRTVAYSSSLPDPTTAGPSRDLLWKVNDGSLDSNTGTTTVTVFAAGPAPTSAPLMLALRLRLHS